MSCYVMQPDWSWRKFWNGFGLFVLASVILFRSPGHYTRTKILQIINFSEKFSEISKTFSSADLVPFPDCLDSLDTFPKNENGHCTTKGIGKMLRKFRSSFNGKLVLMIGDSRMMQIFRYLRSLLSGRLYEERLFSSADAVAQFTDNERNFSIQYYFKPFPDVATREIIHEWTVIKARKPDYLFYETGVWSLYIHGPKSEPEFRRNLTDLAEQMAKTRCSSIPIWVRTLPVHPDVPSPRPVWVKSLYNHTDLLVEKFGQAVEDVARAHRFTVWTSAHHLAKKNPKFYHDKIHPGVPMLRLFGCQMLTALSNHGNCNN